MRLYVSLLLLALLTLPITSYSAELVPIDIDVVQQTLTIGDTGASPDPSASRVPAVFLPWSASAPITGGSSFGTASATNVDGKLILSVSGSTTNAHAQYGTGMRVEGEHTISLIVPDFGESMTTIIFKLEQTADSFTQSNEPSSPYISNSSFISSSLLGVMFPLPIMPEFEDFSSSSATPMQLISGDTVELDIRFGLGSWGTFGFQTDTFARTAELTAVAVQPIPVPEPLALMQQGTGILGLFALANLGRGGNPLASLFYRVRDGVARR